MRVPGDVSLTAPLRGSHPATLSSPGFSPCRSLDLTGPLLLGGVPNLPENFPVTHRDFVGCMRDLYIDSKRIDLASYIANNGTTTGTSTSAPCQRLSSGVRGRSWGCPSGSGAGLEGGGEWVEVDVGDFVVPRLPRQAHLLRLQPLQERRHLLGQLGDLLLPLPRGLRGQRLPPQ